MHCPNCNEHYESGKFCPNCGVGLVEDTPETGVFNINFGDANAIHADGINKLLNRNCSNIDDYV